MKKEYESPRCEIYTCTDNSDDFVMTSAGQISGGNPNDLPIIPINSSDDNNL